MRGYGKFLERYQDQEERWQRVLEQLLAELTEAMSALEGACEVERRLKRPLSAWRKLHRYGLPLEEVHDLLGLRVLCETTEQCRAGLAAIQRTWPAGWHRVKDYIAHPKANGYQSLHVCLRLSDGQLVEVQLRTWKMHHHCQLGEASHWTYKQNIHAGPRLAPSHPQAA